jgi:rubrerythrin
MTDPAAIPQLAGVRVEGMTRGAFMLRGALAAAAASGVGAVGPFVRRAVGQEVASGGDVGIIRFALTLELLEQKFYEEALKKVPKLSSEVKQLTGDLLDHEAQHVDTLTSLLNQLGAAVGAAPKFDFGGAFDSERTFLALAQTFEDTGVQAYNGAAAAIESPDVLETAGSIVQVEARHAGVVRYMRGEPITPGAFDRGVPRQTVEERIKPFTG